MMKLIPRKMIPHETGLDYKTRTLIKIRRPLKNKLRKNTSSTGHIIINNKIKQLNRKIKKGIKQSKENKWTRICNEINNDNNPRKSWNNIKRQESKNTFKNNR